MRPLPFVVLAAAMLLPGCFRRERPAPTSPAPDTREVVMAPGRTSAVVATEPLETMPGPPEPYVDLEMSNAPVRLVLQRLAEIGGLQLIIPPNLDRRISVQYVRVPVSVALNDVLTRAGLRLGTGPRPNLPFDTVTVFYHLPANIDSMSVEAIVRRFGVSRAMAELIVKSRRP
ncbi:MAG TPA: hypothetical protein VFO55_12620 [Gemmatimonadaceae bacterium]|nr:hypothetical protein [Gemmatimonadaceae bacterium]